MFECLVCGQPISVEHAVDIGFGDFVHKECYINTCCDGADCVIDEENKYTGYPTHSDRRY